LHLQWYLQKRNS